MTRLGILVALLTCLAWGALPARGETPATLAIGGKAFAESHILAELAAQTLESNGFRIERRLGLGGTLVTYEALREGAIDLYPEYSGTLQRVILKQPTLAGDAVVKALAERGLQQLSPLGFNNSYALALPQRLAQARNLQTIADLAGAPDLRLGFSLEFLRREDGWPALRAAYALPHTASGLEHALAYPALAKGHLDVTDAYTTDGELARYELVLLRDNRDFFPAYEAHFLARADLPDSARAILERLAGQVTADNMRSMNHRVSVAGESPAAVARSFLSDTGLLPPGDTAGAESAWPRILRNTLEHLRLTGIALALACFLAIPLALWLYRYPRPAQALLYACGLLQTIPSLALLALLVPLVGLGTVPAITALFLYSLLPIVRNTLTGLFSVDPLLKQVAQGLGLTAAQQLRHVELPLALPTVLAGIRTAAIISVGTATLAAFVGAGGLGEPIITGLTLNDHGLVLQGAIPAALLAVAAELLFELLERAVLPEPLRPAGPAGRRTSG